MENKIRISNGVKKIEVNDEGEFITLNLGDDNFVKGFYKIMKYIESEAEKGPFRTGGDITEEAIDSVANISEKIHEKVEALFGEGTCRKVFGDTRPGLGSFMEFFGAIVPFIEEFLNERAAKLNKYGSGRTGSV